MKYCELPFKGLYVYPNGDVRVCGWTYECIGNILEEDLDSIWHGEKAEKVRDSIRNGSFSCCNKVACRICANNSFEEITEEEMKIRAIATDKPKIINCAIDYTCNHKCPSCRHEIFIGNKKYNDDINKIAENLLPILNQAEKVSTNGNGDLFASTCLMEMLKKIQPTNNNFEMSIETNGVLCTERNWEKIKHLSDYDLQITVTPNSFDRQTYKYLSGGCDNLDKLINNLYFIKKLRKENKIKKFNISIVVQDTNYKELPSFVERCLNDFECDKVVIKPIYYWFALTPEEYWFKDILNPKHPYFEDYMEVLEAPILKDERVYFWGAHDIHKAKEHPAYDYKRYFDVFVNILKQDNPEKALENALIQKGHAEVAIYGTNDMAQMMYGLLKKTNIKVTAFIDRDAKVDSFCGMPVTTFKEFKSDMTDVILVSNFAYLTNVTRDLRFRDYQGEIIPFNEIL